MKKYIFLLLVLLVSAKADDYDYDFGNWCDDMLEGAVIDYVISPAIRSANPSSYQTLIMFFVACLTIL